MSSVFLEDDYKLMAEYTFPKVVEMMGSKENMVETTKNTMTKMESQGFTIESLSYTNSSDIYEHNGDTQCVFDQSVIMNTPDGKIENTTAVIAISNNNGKNWVFFDTSGMPRTSVQEFYENLHHDLEIKQSEKKNYIKN